MDCPVLLVAMDADINPRVAAFDITAILYKVRVPVLPITTKLAVYMRLVAYPHEYDREFAIEIKIQDADGRDLKSQTLTQSLKPEPGEHIAQTDFIEVLYGITFSEAAVHQVVVMIDGEVKAEIHLDVVFFPPPREVGG